MCVVEKRSWCRLGKIVTSDFVPISNQYHVCKMICKMMIWEIHAGKDRSGSEIFCFVLFSDPEVRIVTVM